MNVLKKKKGVFNLFLHMMQVIFAADNAEEVGTKKLKFNATCVKLTLGTLQQTVNLKKCLCVCLFLFSFYLFGLLYFIRGPFYFLKEYFFQLKVP